ncbi:substrate-binding periplasmic protein [Halomonas llamarensis]|uniref:Transporter substrate-binding domain-containing protein n=1 Tax=Halomonas llamarensis TaxID=2945104 RepID=A0ABT0SKP4_9GAMM|nr:transporter substrate-binding domain-containing protein [Halomonas llamarensis]MCL7928383.1 transporter substrate-binding domain-containing protein [Halomonas llamarensis]
MRYLLLALVVLFQSPFAMSQERETIFICTDTSSWPPYFYPMGNTWQGLDLKLIDNIFVSANVTYQMNPLPWKRCLESVKKGEDYQVALSATYNSLRDKHYHISNKYYSLTPAYVKKSAMFAKEEVENIASLFEKDRKVCGIAGFNYSHFFSESDQRLFKELAQNAKTFQQLLNQVNYGRCDIGLTRHETMLSLKSLELVDWDSELELERLPGGEPENYFMLISKNIADSRWLLEVVNKGIEDFVK